MATVVRKMGNTYTVNGKPVPDSIGQHAQLRQTAAQQAAQPAQTASATNPAGAAKTAAPTAISAAAQLPNGQTAYNDDIPQLMGNTGNNGYTPNADVLAAKGKMNAYEGQKPGAYAQSDDVANAKKKMEAYEGERPGAYQASPEVIAAQQALANIQNNKPQGYSSKYGEALDNILAQIRNPAQFKYDFNGDELFKYYADDYTRRGKMASMDVMGQAAALTGGYGNSYAQQVGNQAYDEYLTQLYDRGMDLYDRAYQRYLNDQDALKDQYNILAAQDQADYGRYRDILGDWENDRGYATDMYNNERNFDYGKYRDLMGDWNNEMGRLTDMYGNERNFDYGQYRDTVGDWNTEMGRLTDMYGNERNFDYNQYQDQRNFEESKRQYDADLAEKQRQFNASLDWDKMSSQQKYAAEYCMQILANGQLPTAELLAAAGLSEEDARKMMAVLEAPATSSGSGGSGGGGRGGSSTTKATTQQTTQGQTPEDVAAEEKKKLVQQSKTMDNVLTPSVTDIKADKEKKNKQNEQEKELERRKQEVQQNKTKDNVAKPKNKIQYTKTKL